MSKASDAIASQLLLITNLVDIFRNLLRNTQVEQAEKVAAAAQIAALIAEDEATVAAILANNPQLQAFVDELSAATPIDNEDS